MTVDISGCTRPGQRIPPESGPRSVLGLRGAVCPAVAGTCVPAPVHASPPARRPVVPILMGEAWARPDRLGPVEPGMFRTGSMG